MGRNSPRAPADCIALSTVVFQHVTHITAAVRAVLFLSDDPSGCGSEGGGVLGRDTAGDLSV